MAWRHRFLRLWLVLLLAAPLARAADAPSPLRVAVEDGDVTLHAEDQDLGQVLTEIGARARVAVAAEPAGRRVSADYTNVDLRVCVAKLAKGLSYAFDYRKDKAGWTLEKITVGPLAIPQPGSVPEDVAARTRELMDRARKGDRAAASDLAGLAPQALALFGERLLAEDVDGELAKVLYQALLKVDQPAVLPYLTDWVGRFDAKIETTYSQELKDELTRKRAAAQKGVEYLEANQLIAALIPKGMPKNSQVPILASLIRDGSDAVRSRAYQQLQKISGFGALVPIMATLDDPNWVLRREAAAVLGKMGDAAALPALEKALADPHTEVVEGRESYPVREEAKAAIEAIRTNPRVPTKKSLR